MSNAHRAEYSFMLGDNEYKMRLSTRVIAEIEGALKRPFGLVIQQMSQSSFECVSIAASKAMPLPVNAVYALMDEFGILPFTEAIGEAIKISGLYPSETFGGAAPESPKKVTA
jgi:hypothetical protein